jgi:hypothetical protein
VPDHLQRGGEVNAAVVEVSESVLGAQGLLQVHDQAAQ